MTTLRNKIKGMPFFVKILSAHSTLKLLDVQLRSFILPAAFSLVAAVLEGFVAILLIPVIKGVVTMDFTFVKDAPCFNIAGGIFPSLNNFSNAGIFATLMLAILLLVFSHNMFQYLSTISVAYRVRSIARHIRELMFSRYLSFGKQFFDKRSPGSLQTALTNFTQLFSEKLIHAHNALSHFFMAAVYIIIMFKLSLQLTVIVIACSPFLYFLSERLAGKIKTSSQLQASYLEGLGKRVSNAIFCTPIIKSYQNEDEEKKKFDIENKNLAETEFSLDKKIFFIQPLFQVVLYIFILCLLAFVAFMVARGGSDLSKFIIYVYVMRRVTTSVTVLSHFRGSLASIDGPIQYITSTMNSDGKFFIRGGSVKFTGLKENIQFKHLSFSYEQDQKVLKDVNVSIEKGKITALVGPTGSGKTTLVSLLLRFYDCPPATIFIDGIDIRKLALKPLLKSIAYVSQNALFFDDTLRNNITYGLDREMTDAELFNVLKKVRLHEHVTSLHDGLDTFIGDAGAQLSGGEKQRLALARALVKGSEIFIMDEATASLDAHTEKLLQEAINETMRGKTAVVIAHRPTTIRSADKIIVLEDGVVAEEDTFQELINKKGAFYRLWQEQKFF